MYRYIEQLRKGPDHHKRRFAIVASGVITGAIFLAWLSVLLPQNATTIVAENQQATVPEAVTPIGSLQASVAQAITGIKSLFENTTKTVSDVNLQDQYSKMKDQVQSGQIQLAPANP